MLKEKIKNYRAQKKWRSLNRHNNTFLKCACPYEQICVGRYTYGMLDVHFSDTERKLIIGDFVSIADNVKFLVSGEHNIDRISTFPFKDLILGLGFEGGSKGDIIVDDDVWIGYGVTIMSGVHIGQGAVIAAGAVVTKDVEPYSIVGGIPATLIRYRFNEKVIKELMKIDFSKFDYPFIRDNIDFFYRKIINVEDIDPVLLDKKRKKENE